ncbi:hypothetical protein [Mycolicibacterium pulveris]|uniref:hypothetical protein n=1 Tax=Mycolicibacterium pulveris TaxID=36813 RepID=UPI003CF2125B
MHLAAWSGLRAAELAGLRVGDVTVPKASLNPNAPVKPGTVRVEQTIAWTGATPTAIPPKTKGSRRTVPLTAATTELLRDYLAEHPRRDEPTAPLFPNVRLRPPRPTGVGTEPRTHNPLLGDMPGIEPGNNAKAHRQATALAELSTAEAGERMVLDWTAPLRHATFYKAVYRPAVLRANRAATARGDKVVALQPKLKFHALRHTYASLCIAAGRPPLEVAVYGPREGHDDFGCVCAPFQHRRLRRRNDRPGRDGRKSDVRRKCCAAVGLSFTFGDEIPKLWKEQR